MRTVFVAFLLCVAPTFAFALPHVGFPDASVWLSNTNPKHGEKIRMYTVVYNGTGGSVAGTLTFLVDGTDYSAQPITLEAQSSKVISAEWQATAGTHTFGARFGSDGSTVETAEVATTIQIKVAEPPPPTVLQKTVQQASAVAGDIASPSVPVVTKVANAVFEKTEALRNAGIEYLESKLDKPQSTSTVTSSSVAANPKTATAVAGFEDKAKIEPESAEVPQSSRLHSAGQIAASAALFTFKSAYLFYPLFALVFFFLLYRAYRLFRRPDY